MTRQRLRPAYTPAQLADVYAAPHRHAGWDDHRLRVAATLAVASWFTTEYALDRIADLSCGDAAIAEGLDPNAPSAGRGLCRPCDGRQTAARPDQRGGWNNR